MWVTVVWLGQSVEPLAVGPGPYCLNWLFGDYSFWMDIWFYLDIVGRALVLPQSHVLDFVDSPWEALPSLRSGWGLGLGVREGSWREQKEERKWEMHLLNKIIKDRYFF